MKGSWQILGPWRKFQNIKSTCLMTVGFFQADSEVKSLNQLLILKLSHYFARLIPGHGYRCIPTCLINCKDFHI